MIKVILASFFIFCPTGLAISPKPSVELKDAAPKTRVLSSNEMLSTEIKEIKENDQAEIKKSKVTTKFFAWDQIINDLSSSK